ncbi:MAG: hypothetical protein PHE56_00580 [Bacteroidales bacterium]|nr:hypothetical protein [Bacteroidales bacterium]
MGIFISDIKTVFGLLLILFSLIIAYQDFRDRSVSVFSLICVLAVSLGILIIEILADNGFAFAIGLIINIVLLLIMFLIVKLYFKIRKKDEIVDVVIGKGDLVFILSPAILFGPFSFIVFIILCCIISLLSLILIKLIRQNYREIPFAGVGAIIVAFTVIINWMFSVNLFKDDYILYKLLA